MANQESEEEEIEKALRARGILNELTQHFPYDIEAPEALAFEVAMHCIMRGEICPSWASRLVTKGWQRFIDLDCDTLGEAFGIPEHKRRGAKKTDSNARLMHFEVMLLRELGHPVKDSAKQEGAYSVVGRKFNVSPQSVEKAVGEYRKRMNRLGGNPDVDWEQMLTPINKAMLAPLRRPKNKPQV
jgi:hypothetical protein